MSKPRVGRSGQRARPDFKAIEARRALVSLLVLRRYSVRRIVEHLAALPPGERPADFSAATIGRDLVALRAEWRAVREDATGQVIAEELARLAEVQAGVYERAVAGEGESIDRWLALHRQRVALLVGGRGGGPAGGQVGITAGSGGVQLPGPPPGGALRVTVEYVDDWRAARGAVAGALVLAGGSEGVGEDGEAAAG